MAQVITQVFPVSPAQLQRTVKTITLDGSAGGGAVGAVAVATVTGDVFIKQIHGVATTTPTSAGGGTLALGVTGSTSLFIGATTATGITSGANGTRKNWVSTTPTASGIAAPAATKDTVISHNIILTAATADVTAGVIRIDIDWYPISADGAIT